MKAKHRPSIDERLDSGMVHVNSIIPNNLRICPVADKHESQLSGKKKKKNEREKRKEGLLPVAFTTIDDKSPRGERVGDGGPPHYAFVRYPPPSAAGQNLHEFCLFRARLQTRSTVFTILPRASRDFRS